MSVGTRREREGGAAYAGHASAAMTLDTYADLFDDDLDAVAVALVLQRLCLTRCRDDSGQPGVDLPPRGAASKTTGVASPWQAEMPELGRFSCFRSQQNFLKCGQNVGKRPFLKMVRTLQPGVYTGYVTSKRGAPGGIRTPGHFLRTELLFH